MMRLLILSLLPCFALTLGCGSGAPPTVPAGGTVTLDGEPVEGATVNFLSESNITASGKTDASGKFTLKTLFGTEMIDGAVVGKHGVAVVKTESEGMETMDPKQMAANMTSPVNTSDYKPKYLIPAKYNNPTMSQLSADVTEGGANDFTFELKSK